NHVDRGDHRPRGLDPRRDPWVAQEPERESDSLQRPRWVGNVERPMTGLLAHAESSLASTGASIEDGEQTFDNAALSRRSRWSNSFGRRAILLTIGSPLLCELERLRRIDTEERPKGRIVDPDDLFRYLDDAHVLEEPDDL